MQPPKTRACATAPWADALSLSSLATRLVMIVAAENDNPTPRPKMAWNPYCFAAVSFSADAVSIRPTPNNCIEEAPTSVYPVLLLLLDIAPPRKDPTAQPPSRGKMCTPACRTV